MSQTNVLSPQLRQAFIQLIVNRTGLQIREHDQAAFQAIILKQINHLGVPSAENYYQLLQSKADQTHEAWKSLISEITNAESFFFRDKGQFKLLKNVIFPSLIQQKADNKTLRICSAGCSTGEEPYSIAILLKRLIPDLEMWNLTILGVDINSAAIAKAREGIFRSWSFRCVNRDIQQRFFHRKGDTYRIDQTIRDMVDFQTVNLLEDPFNALGYSIEYMDLILCRNVFIYFSKSAIAVVLDKFHEALLPQGYLLAGHAELHSQNPKKFQVKIFEESIVYQRLAHDASHSISINPLSKPIAQPSQRAYVAKDPQSLEDLLDGNNVQMQKVSLNLLRQLPADTRIARLGNLTASELIFQIEQNLKATD
ncbi:MAG: CheR family methyltransferase [Cyanobacteria bacterium P01_F01_bin.86]